MPAARFAWLHAAALALALATVVPARLGAQARISEATRPILTYPFSDPDPVPILTRDARLYPYHAFGGYASRAIPRDWTVVTLENDLIAVYVLPEVGGKVWGAVVKASGHEFIYRNEVLKFRNIALRGPWTSGGIEFNFGVIGHTPSTATPVDYVLRENADGSVSCIVGMMDLPSRTQWRVEIRLPADKAAFETNVLWYNPTPFEQPYYNWMTAAAPARPDLLMTIPGNAYLGHPGDRHDWPVSPDGRLLADYAENDVGGNKSYHVVGEVADYFGGYLREAGYGFGHWAPHDQMPGQKLWLWALSREGGIWEELLTDTDGQYVEYQAGRLLVQYAPGSEATPISQAGFEAGATDRWSETWFPLEGTGGLTAASRDGAIHAEVVDGRLAVTVSAFSAVRDTLVVWAGDTRVLVAPLALPPLVPVTRTAALPGGSDYRVVLPRLGIDHRSDPTDRTLTRPWESDTVGQRLVPEADRLATAARQLALARRYPEARRQYEALLAASPWHRGGLLGMAELELRRGRFAEGLDLVRRLLQLDAYDPAANFLAANLNRGLGRLADARDAYGWAARSLRYRTAARVALAEMALAEGDLAEASRHAQAAIDHDRYNLPAREVLAIVARRSGQDGAAAALRHELLQIDPLHHFVAAERFLVAPEASTRSALLRGLRGEYPEQSLLELAIDYHRRGERDGAVAILALAEGPLADAWSAWLRNEAGDLPGAAPVAFTFPYRTETLPVLRWVVERRPHWSWRYLLALNLWAVDRPAEAAALMRELAEIDEPSALIARASLLATVDGRDPGADLRRAVELAPGNRLVRIALVRHLQEAGKWQEAAAASAAGRATFRGDFNLDLLHVGSLLQLGQSEEAIAILDATQVLPSENSRQSHQLYRQAHTMAALDALEAGRNAIARRHLLAALEWPEHLGQGRPYQPEERLVRYLLGVVAMREGNGAAAATEWQAVSSASGAGESGLDLLARLAAAMAEGTPFPPPVPPPPATLDERLLARAWALRR